MTGILVAQFNRVEAPCRRAYEPYHPTIDWRTSGGRFWRTGNGLIQAARSVPPVVRRTPLRTAVV